MSNKLYYPAITVGGNVTRVSVLCTFDWRSNRYALVQLEGQDHHMVMKAQEKENVYFFDPLTDKDEIEGVAAYLRSQNPNAKVEIES